MRLLRDNTEDPRVMRDLEMLAGAYSADGEDAATAAPASDPAAGDSSVAADAAAGITAGPGDDAAGGEVEEREPSPLDDSFVRTFVTASVHVRRFFPYYLGAAMWLAVMALMSPAGDGADGDVAARQPAVANFADAGDVADTSGDVAAPAPAFADIAATPSDSSFGLSTSPSTFGDSSFASGDSSSATFDSSAFDTGSSGSTGSSGIAIEDEPEPLRITKSGYSSRTGGTPLEQSPPGEGLPVGAVGGEATKRSFIAVSGDEKVAKLKLVDDPSNVGVEQAAVRACAITAEWEAARGVAMDAEPAWGDPCVDGVRGEDGVWTFDLSSFGEPSEIAGFALTPGTAAGLSFNLTFEPSLVRAS